MLRIGMLPFTNGVVPNARFHPENALLVFEVPSRLNRAIAGGELDISAVSSFEALRNSDQYLIWPHLLIAAREEAGSVFLVTKKRLSEISGGRILLSGASETSIHLAQLLLSHLGVDTEFIYQEQEDLQTETVSQIFSSYDGAVLIGDHAQTMLGEEQVICHDLATLWKSVTGLPFVFALWVIRKDSYQKFPQEILKALSALTSSAAWGQMHLKELWEKDSRHLSYRDFVDFLGRKLHYFPEARDWLGLAVFARELLKAGFLEKSPCLEYLNV